MTRRNKLVILLFLTLLIIFCAFYYMRNISNIFYFESYIPAVGCAPHKIESSCYSGTVKFTSANGNEMQFSYTPAYPPKIINNTGSVSSFKKGDKVQIKTSGDNTGDDKVITSIRAIN